MLMVFAVADDEATAPKVPDSALSLVISSTVATIEVTWALPVTVIAPLPCCDGLQYQNEISGEKAPAWKRQPGTTAMVPPVANATPVIEAAVPEPSVPAAMAIR